MSRSNWAEWVPPDLASGPTDAVVGGEQAQVQMPPWFWAKVADRRALEPAVADDLSERGRPVLEPLFPVGPFTPESACPHRRPIPLGSRLCCMVCDQSGLDGHPHLKKTAVDEAALKAWKPPEGGDAWSTPDLAEPTTYTPPAAARRAEPRTRRQKRAEARATANR